MMFFSCCCELIPPLEYMYIEKMVPQKVILLNPSKKPKYYSVDWTNTDIVVCSLGTRPCPFKAPINGHNDFEFIQNHFKEMKYYDGYTWTNLHKNDQLYKKFKQMFCPITKLTVKLNIIKYRLHEIIKATDGFSKLIAKGGYGKVYVGILRNTEVAIKRMINPDNFILESFYRELNMLAMVRHPHIIQLLGICLHDESQPILVFEYMCQGSLADHIEDLTEQNLLLICLQTAQAISYLHSCYPPIIHGDIKPENILLDKYFNAKVADVGISRTLPTYKTVIHGGTLGYLPPEATLSTKVDVYSFGILLHNCLFKHRRSLKIKQDISQNMSRLAILADICIKFDPDERPCISEVYESLEKLSHKECHGKHI